MKDKFLKVGCELTIIILLGVFLPSCDVDGAIVVVSNYPRYYYSNTYYYRPSNNNNQQPVVDQTVYGNFVQHCSANPAYTINKNERYLIYGSVPSTFVADSPFTDNRGVPINGMVTPSCGFSLTGPSGWYLRVNFYDRQCNSWPTGASLQIYNGNNYGASSTPTSVMMNLPSSNVNNCQAEFYSTSNTISFGIFSGQTRPVSNFNFTITVVATQSRSSSTTSSGAYAAFVVLVVIFVIAGVLIRIFCWRNVVIGCCPECCCCCPTAQRPVAQIYTVPAEPSVVTMAPGVPMPPSQSAMYYSTPGAPGQQPQVSMYPNSQYVSYKPYGPNTMNQAPPAYGNPIYGQVNNNNNGQFYYPTQQPGQHQPPPPPPPSSAAAYYPPPAANANNSASADVGFRHDLVIQPAPDAVRPPGYYQTVASDHQHQQQPQQQHQAAPVSVDSINVGVEGGAAGVYK